MRRPFAASSAVPFVALLVAALPVMTSTPARASSCPAAAASYGGGTGTAPDAHRIDTVAHLLRLAATSADWSDDFVVTADLDLTGCTWTPIGSAATPFAGTFDGGGRTITGLTVTSSSRYVGFFGVASGATIEGVRLVGVDVESTGNDYAGAIVGEQLGGTIRDVEVSGAVDGNYWIGGIAGRSTGRIEDARSAVSVTAVWNIAGGIVGELDGGAVVRARATGDVRAGVQAGGIVGYADGGATIDESAALGDVIAASGGRRYVGGLVGDLNGASIEDSYAIGDVTADQDVGGLVGAAPVTTVARTYALGAVSGSTDRGALIGRVASGVSASFWNPDDAGIGTGVAGAQSTAAAMRTLAPYIGASWAIVEGWTAPGADLWGRCDRVNDGAPFLLWEYDTDPCTTPAPAAASTLAVACEGAPVAGATVTCTVTGGEPGIDILWRAAYNPVFASAGVRLGPDGSGTFAFVVPPGAVGAPLSVELVAWLVPLELGVVAPGAGVGAVPTRVAAGGGPVLGAGALVIASGVAGLLFLLVVAPGAPGTGMSRWRPRGRRRAAA